MKRALILSVILGLGASLSAQDWTIAAKLGFVSAQGDLASLTYTHQGLMGELSAQKNLSEGLDIRVHAGHMVVRRETFTGLSASDARTNAADAKNTWGGAEFVYAFFGQKLDLYTGPTLNQWDFIGARQGPLGDTNWHMGWRAGATWKVNAKWGVDVHYGLSEWARFTPTAPAGPARQVNPSWVGVAARYVF
jgi:hypothetical protein